jgi:hypothetical protein
MGSIQRQDAANQLHARLTRQKKEKERRLMEMNQYNKMLVSYPTIL